MTTLDEQHPAPLHRILHLSDTHFVDGNGALYGKVDTEANLGALLDRFDREDTRVEAVVLTGDLADAGSPEAYGRLRGLVEPAARRLGAEVVWVMGNHDERGAFRSGLLGQAPTTDPFYRVHDLGGLRLVVLDSTVPGHHHGEISDDQYAWLADVLAQPAPHGTLLALHHPPIPSPIPVMALVGLREQHRLAAALAGTDVRAILGGHLHYSTASTLAGIPVSVAAATCYTQDLLRAPAVRAQDGGQSINLVEVYPDRVVHSTVSLVDHPTVYEATTEDLAAALVRLAASTQSAIPATAGTGA